MAKFENKNAKINLRDIKSSYNIKRIFLFFYEKYKLKMIVYNKELQKMWSLGIENYKEKSGKYKKDGKNGKGKEYLIDTNILIFEGEYKNGKGNGKGKEYYNNSKLRFEGEYLKGKRWNEQGYNINGNIEFEIKDGEGNIKEYNFEGELEFEGE